jgi:hypothetical protein
MVWRSVWRGRLLPMNDDVLDREFAYTPWHGSCRELYGLDANGEPIHCRRPLGHEDALHAAGYGASRVRWQLPA